jgi:hypothetical protein
MSPKYVQAAGSDRRLDNGVGALFVEKGPPADEVACKSDRIALIPARRP